MKGFKAFTSDSWCLSVSVVFIKFLHFVMSVLNPVNGIGQYFRISELFWKGSQQKTLRFFWGWNWSGPGWPANYVAMKPMDVSGNPRSAAERGLDLWPWTGAEYSQDQKCKETFSSEAVSWIWSQAMGREQHLSETILQLQLDATL